MKHLRRFLALTALFCLCALPSANYATTVATSGVPVQLYVTSPPTVCMIVTVMAKSSNSGTIWIGFGPTVSAANGYGIALGPPITAGQPGGSYSLFPVGNAPIWNLGALWIDATHSGDGVSFTCQ
jgi:hypothetical protein